MRHLVEKPSGFYFQATPAMRAAGICSEPLGRDLAQAVDRARALNAAWDGARRGEDQPVEPHRGTLDWLVWHLKRSDEFLDKAPSTQDDLDHSLKVILPIFGPSYLRSVTADQVRRFYRGLRSTGSVHRAARHLKWLRYLFNLAAREGLIDFNPTLAVRIKRPPPRQATWERHQVICAVAAAEDLSLWGVALVIQIAYDTGLRPGDIRSLRPMDLKGDVIWLTPSKTAHLDTTAKPYPLWPETVAMIEAYQKRLAVLQLPDAPLIRAPDGRAYNKRLLEKHVRRAMAVAGLPMELQLRDLRRTTNKEAAEAGATEAELAAQTHHSIDRSRRILDTYVPKSAKLARNAKNKRRRNAKRTKV